MKKKNKKYIGSSPMKIAPIAMMGLSLAGSAVDYFTNRAQRRKAEKKAAEFEAEAQPYFDAYKEEVYTNPYANMQNVYEDATIDQRAAEFERQTVAQQQADTLAALSAGQTGAGAAALATAMSRQGALQAQRAAASIAGQEAAIQRQQLAEQARIQGLQIKGEELVKEQNRQRDLDLYQSSATKAGLEYDLATQAAQAQQQALIGGVTTLAEGFLPGGAISGLFGDKKSTADNIVGTLNNPQFNYGDSSLFEELKFTNFRK